MAKGNHTVRGSAPDTPCVRRHVARGKAGRLRPNFPRTTGYFRRIISSSCFRGICSALQPALFHDSLTIRFRERITHWKQRKASFFLNFGDALLRAIGLIFGHVVLLDGCRRGPSRKVGIVSPQQKRLGRLDVGVRLQPAGPTLKPVALSILAGGVAALRAGLAAVGRRYIENTYAPLRRLEFNPLVHLPANPGRETPSPDLAQPLEIKRVSERLEDENGAFMHVHHSIERFIDQPLQFGPEGVHALVELLAAEIVLQNPLGLCSVERADGAVGQRRKRTRLRLKSIPDAHLLRQPVRRGGQDDAELFSESVSLRIVGDLRVTQIERHGTDSIGPGSGVARAFFRFAPIRDLHAKPRKPPPP